MGPFKTVPSSLTWREVERNPFMILVPGESLLLLIAYRLQINVTINDMLLYECHHNTDDSWSVVLMCTLW